MNHDSETVYFFDHMCAIDTRHNVYLRVMKLMNYHYSVRSIFVMVNITKPPFQYNRLISIIYGYLD